MGYSEKIIARLENDIFPWIGRAPIAGITPPQLLEVRRRDLRGLTGRGPMIFLGERHHERPMSENTISAALRAMGFGGDEATAHGFRASARTMLHERLCFSFSPDVIEAQLAHSVRDSLGQAYNRTEFIEQRREMLRSTGVCAPVWRPIA